MFVFVDMRIREFMIVVNWIKDLIINFVIFEDVFLFLKRLRLIITG